MVYVLLADGFEEIEAIAPIDILRRANVEVATVSLSNELMVTGGHGICVKADIFLEQIGFQELEMLVLPGGLAGVNAIAKNPAAMDLIKKVWKEGKKIAAICAAPSLLAKAGIIDGLSFVCYPSVSDDVITAGGIYIPDQNVVCDNNLITGKAAGSSINFALELVATIINKETAEQIRNTINP